MLGHNNVVQIYRLQWDNLPPKTYLEEEIQKAHKRIAVLIVSFFCTMLSITTPQSQVQVKNTHKYSQKIQLVSSFQDYACHSSFIP